MIRVLVVDDHPVVREGLAAVLESRSDLEVAGVAGSAAEAVEQARELCPDVVLLDLEMPGGGGADAIPALREAAPAAAVLIFTAYLTEEGVLEAVEAGARGYLLKGAPGEELAAAIRAVHGGGTYLEPSAARLLVDRAARPRPARPVLTPREREVLRLVADGLSNKQIARRLQITERTVKFHVASVNGKVGAENRTGAVAIALERRLL